MLFDLQLPDGTGIDVCRAASVDPSGRGLLATSSGDDEALMAAVLAGAAGYLVKVALGSDITARDSKGGRRQVADRSHDRRPGEPSARDRSR